MCLPTQVMNAGRLIKCSQSFSEENSSLSKKAITEIARRVSALEAAAPPSEAARTKWAADQEKLIKVGNCLLCSGMEHHREEQGHVALLQLQTKLKAGRVGEQPKHAPLAEKLRGRSGWQIRRTSQRGAPPACRAAEQAGSSGRCCATCLGEGAGTGTTDMHVPLHWRKNRWRSHASAALPAIEKIGKRCTVLPAGGLCTQTPSATAAYQALS